MNKILRQRPDNFIDRVNEMKQIGDTLKPRWRLPFHKTGDRRRAVLLCGMAGVGKTDLAIEAAYRLLKYFPDGVLWQFVGQSSVEDILNAIAAAFEIAVSGMMLPQKKIAIRKALINKRSLLIFDNVERGEPILEASTLPVNTATKEKEPEQVYLTNLRRLLATRFTEGELHTLCFDLGMDYENLPGERKIDKARELVAHFDRRDSISELLRIGKQLHPDIPWDKETSPEGTSSESQSVSPEQLLSEVFDVVGNCAVIITSRSKLRLPGTQRIDVLELPLKDAVEFFAQTVGHNLDDAERKLAEDICERLGRLPLAIALASSQVEILRIDLDYLSQRIEQALNVLKLENKSVRAAFQSTYAVLDSKDKMAFASLGVFSEHGFSLDAAQAVTGDSQVENRLMRLITLSLVKPLGGARYALHPLLKLFAQEKLKNVSAYHDMADYYLELARQNQRDFELLEPERPNILIALYWAQRAEQWSLVVELTEALLSPNAYYGFLAQRGYWEEGMELLQLALVAAEELGDVAFEARFNADIGVLYYWWGRNDEARLCYQKALAKFKTLDDTQRVIQVLHRSGYIEDDEDNYARARELYERSLTLSKELGEPDLISLSRHLVGVVAYHEGSYKEARQRLEQSLGEALARGDTAAVARIQRRLAAVARMEGHYAARAEKGRYFDEAWRLLGKVLKVETSQRSRARALRQLGMVAQEEGKLNSAFEYFEQSLELFEKLGNRKGISAVNYNLSSVAFERGDYKKAEQLCQESLKVARELKCRYGEALTLRLLARLAFERGNRTRALELLPQAIQILEAIQSPHAQEFKELLGQWE